MGTYAHMVIEIFDWFLIATPDRRIAPFPLIHYCKYFTEES